jgi:predicted FMN-binding regulatory protein PaiB
MYVPKAFAEHDAALLQEAIARYPLATLVTAYDGALVANHLPMLADPDRADTLLCHVARANALWTTVDDRAEVLAVFSGPEAYVSPSFYATKREHGRVVPTWNYVAVHVYGTLRVLDGPAALRRIVGLLTAAHEASHARRSSNSSSARSSASSCASRASSVSGSSARTARRPIVPASKRPCAPLRRRTIARPPTRWSNDAPETRTQRTERRRDHPPRLSSVTRP